MRALLVGLSLALVALAGCADPGDESSAGNDTLNNSTMETADDRTNMCLEGAIVCDDTPGAPVDTAGGSGGGYNDVG